MKLFKRSFAIVFAITTLICCMVFGCLNNQKFLVEAASFSNSAVELKLTGYNGYTPLSYFDKTEQSKVIASKNSYYNYNYQKVNQYYIVDANVSNLFGAYSSGISEFMPYGEYLTLANSGVLYAYARTGIVTESGAKNTVTISLKHNNQTVSQYNTKLGSINSSEVYLPYYYKTNAIKVVADKSISFTYTNNEKSSWFSPAEFKLFEPSIVFKTVVNNVTILNSDETVQYGGVVKLDATNAVLDITADTPLVSYFKDKHKIEYEIVQGSEMAYTVGSYLFFQGQTSGTVKVRAKCLKDSESNQYIYSDTVTYNYVCQKVDINVEQNFDDSAVISGVGDYYVGDNVTLIANMNFGYSFAYWELNGEKKYTKNISFVCQSNNSIKLFAKRNVTISEVSVKDKIYDGNTSAEISYVKIDGLLSTHDVYLSNFEVAYYSATAGTKMLSICSIPELQGNDASWYVLSSSLPTIYGKILPKPVTLTIMPSEKVYGDIDPSYPTEIIGLVQGETLAYEISREQNENVGSYLLSATTNNDNYDVTIIENYLTINKKYLSIQNTLITKEYDQTTGIIIQPVLQGIAFNDDISAKIYADFATKNVANNINITIDNIVLFGLQKNNYALLASAVPYTKGNITCKDVIVDVQNASKIYGDEDPTYKYTISGVLSGDNLYGQVVRDLGENVGTYDISYQTNNANYNVQSNVAKLSITKRPATVYALAAEKTYGTTDPIFFYLSSGLLPGDYLRGDLSREQGENAGKYKINIGTVANANYDLQFISNDLAIQKRVLEGDINFNSKIYDGTDALNGYTYNFSNMISTDNLTVSIDGHLENKNVGTSIKVVISQINLSNPNYILNIDDKYVSISRRNIDINPYEKSKVYGQNDEIITYEAQNIVEGETLNGVLVRSAGENVGSYQIQQGSITNENNPNYNIAFHNISSYLIVKKPIIVHSMSLSKHYGEVDPICKFELIIGSLEFDDIITDIITGTPARQEGEMPGVYAYTVGTVRTQSINYDVVYVPSGSLTISKLDIVVYANACSKSYGDDDPAFSYYSNDTDLNTLNLSLTRIQGENVGNYTITYETLFHNIYNITFVENYLTILPRYIILKADSKIKFYGDNDPKLTCSVFSGMLCYQNKLDDILSGEMERTDGENIGAYTISKGSLNTNLNYEFDFVQGNLNILKRPITVQATDNGKTYKSDDPTLLYEVVQGELIGEDRFVGNIERELGEDLGQYSINQGNLSLNSNYDINFVAATFTITKAPLKIKVYDNEKQYGNNDPDYRYDIVEGELHSGESLIGTISREVGENVQTYNFCANFYNPNYDIEYDLGMFAITKRIIKIEAKSYTINYSEDLPTLEYEIVEGSILPGDTLSGDIYKVAGEDAGCYDINSTLTLGRNYKIEYTKGKFTILPINISLNCSNITKTYGQSDPVIPYSIVSGVVKAGDELQGLITRESGEDIGEYSLVPSFANTNYNISIARGVFKILPKSVTLYATVMDKIYDENTTAYIVHPTLSGVIDEGINIAYDNENCADFYDNIVGNSKNVFLHDIYLVGEKAYNYSLVLPILKGNITHNVLSNGSIQMQALKNSELYFGSELVINEATNHDVDIVQTKMVVKTMNLSVQNNDQLVELSSKVQIDVNMGSRNFQNLKVYVVDENGDTKMIQSTYANGILSFEAFSLGDVIIVADNLQWLDIASLASILLMLSVGMSIALVKLTKRRKYAKQK